MKWYLRLKLLHPKCLGLKNDISILPKQNIDMMTKKPKKTIKQVP